MLRSNQKVYAKYFMQEAISFAVKEQQSYALDIINVKYAMTQAFRLFAAVH